MALSKGEFVAGQIDTLSGACGVAHADDFLIHDRDAIDPNWWYSPKPFNIQGGGAGWLTAGFVDTRECREMYALLCRDARLVFQTPVRTNRNSGRRFFFCVFDTGRRRNG